MRAFPLAVDGEDLILSEWKPEVSLVLARARQDLSCFSPYFPYTQLGVGISNLSHLHK